MRQKLRDWIMARANDTSMPNEKRAEAYAILAGKDWDCSYKITELAGREAHHDRGRQARRLPTRSQKTRRTLTTSRKCVVRGLEEAETAIKYDPNSESAWSYKTNLLLEAAKHG